MEGIIKLSEKQQEIANHIDGALLVKAGAGSGKTRVLVERIKNILSDSKRKVLAITFTNKAAEEMKDRLSESMDLGDKLFVGTFHSFCQSVLEIRYSLLGYEKMPHIFSDEADRLKLLENAMNELPYFANIYNKKEESEKPKFAYRALDYIAKLKRNLWDDAELLKHAGKETFLLYKEYQAILISQNAIDFDDLIKLTYNLFINNPHIAGLYARSFRHICIDEAQDLNKAQYLLLKSLIVNTHSNVMMVGDPNQSIFAFNGASSSFMNKSFVEDFKPVEFHLNKNYRSSLSVLKAANKIIPNANSIDNIALKGDFIIEELDDEEKEAAWVVEKIESFIKTNIHDDIEGVISLEKMAVLARNKYVFKYLEKLFIEKKIEYYYKITPGALKFESDFMRIFNLAVCIKLNPQDSLHNEKLREYLKCSTSGSLNEYVLNITDSLHHYALQSVLDLDIKGDNFKKTLNELSDFIKISEESDNEKLMILHDIDELISHWVNYAKVTENKSLLNFKNSMALGKTHVNKKEKGVCLSSVHTMKGQEFDIVFIMGADEDTFPDYRAIKKGGIDLEQERNNMYVAFTRAKRFLYVTYPKHRKMPWGAVRERNISQFLKEF